MPTSEERREVAARLRNTLLTEGASQYMMEHDCDEPYAVAEVVFRNLRHLLGFNETYSVHAVANRLADLIEPQEHICLGCIKWSAIEGNPVKGVCAEFSDPEDSIERATPYYGYCHEWEGA